MLSHGSGEPGMSHPDYEQQAHHHSCLLVLIRGIGSSKPRSLQKIFERVQRVNNVKIKGHTAHHTHTVVPFIQNLPNYFLFFIINIASHLTFDTFF